MADDTVLLGWRQEIIIRSLSAKNEVKFLAFLTDYSDNFTANWEKTAVYGRQDPISTFKNTERSLSFGITIPASSVKEAMDNFKKIHFLQRMLYPRYKTIATGDTIISTPPLFGIYFLPLITEDNDFLYGTVDNVNMTPIVEEGFLFSDERDPYPRSYGLSLTLNVIHRENLGWNSSGKGRNEYTKALANSYGVQKFFKGK